MLGAAAFSDITFDTGATNGNVFIECQLVDGTANDWIVNVSLRADGNGGFGMDADDPNDDGVLDVDDVLLFIELVFG